MDNIQGTTGDDVIGGVVGGTATLQAFDTVNGGGGYDTMKVQLGAAYGGGATISNVEEIQLTATGVFGFNATGIAGVEKFVNNGSGGNLAITGVTGAVNLDVNNIASQTTALTFAGGLTGSGDTVNLGLNNVTGGAGAAITLTGATAALNELEKVVITTSGTASNVQLATNATQTSLKTIEIAGDKNLTLALAADNTATFATTIDASALTGNLTLSGLGNANHTITGGSGNDTFQFGGNFTSADKVDGGAGNNTLSANGAQLAAITTKLADVKNIQTLMLGNDVAAVTTVINAANFGGAVSNVRIVDQGAGDIAAVTFNGLTAAADGSSNNIRFDGDLGANGGSFTFNIAGATDPGTANAVTLDMRGAATTVTSTINLAGVETVTIDATNATGTQLFNLGAASLKSLTVKGTQAVDIDGAALGANVETVDASALTVGGLNVQLSGAASTGANVTGSAQGDLIVGSNLKDVISTGGGADTVIASGGQDVITLGGGADLFRIQTGANAQTAANSVTIKDFVAGTDDISLNVGAASVFAGVTFTAGTSTAAAMADALSSTTAVNSLADVYTQLGATLTAGNFAATGAAAAANQLVARVVEFTTGDSAGKYLVINDNNAGFDAATDIVINVTGVTGTISAADFVFA